MAKKSLYGQFQRDPFGETVKQTADVLKQKYLGEAVSGEYDYSPMRIALAGMANEKYKAISDEIMGNQEKMKTLSQQIATEKDPAILQTLKTDFENIKKALANAKIRFNEEVPKKSELQNLAMMRIKDLQKKTEKLPESDLIRNLKIKIDSIGKLISSPQIGSDALNKALVLYDETLDALDKALFEEEGIRMPSWTPLKEAKTKMDSLRLVNKETSQDALRKLMENIPKNKDFTEQEKEESIKYLKKYLK